MEIPAQNGPVFGQQSMDNLSSHKSLGAARAMRNIGAWFLFRSSGKTPHRGLFCPPQPLQPRFEPGLRPFRAELIYQINSKTPFTPIELAFSKLKVFAVDHRARTDGALMVNSLEPMARHGSFRKTATRPYDALWQAVGHVCNLFTDEECYNFFKVAGYRTL